LNGVRTDSATHVQRSAGTVFTRRGAGVDVIMAECLRLSGKRVVYDNLADMELRLTMYAAQLPQADADAA
jgi:hypothetical protein